MAEYRRPEQLNQKSLPRPFVAGREIWTELSEFAWRCAFKNIHFRAGIPGPWYMYNALNPENLWVWDSCFMALYARYLPDIFPGVQSLDNFYAWQRADGYISMTYVLCSGREAYGERINPPLFAWAEWEYYRTTGRADRIERVLPHLVRHYEWLFLNRRNDLNLFWFEDAGSSGMDNSPRGRRNAEAGRHMGWVDLSSQVALLALCISRLADAIGESGTAARFRAEHEYVSRWARMRCWCPRSGFFHDRLDSSNWLASKTAAGFWPMLAEFAGQEQVEGLCAHLQNPDTFGRPCPVPSLSRDDPNYTENGCYWLGGVWAPINYMVFTGLRRQGRGDLARTLAMKYLDHMAQVYTGFAARPKTIWEAYSPEIAEPARCARESAQLAMHDFAGWTAIGPTAVLYECIIGLEADVPANTLLWDVGLARAHGIDNYPFGKGRVDLRAEERKSPGDPVKITVKSSIDLDLVARCGERESRIVVRKGAPKSFAV